MREIEIQVEYKKPAPVSIGAGFSKYQVNTVLVGVNIMERP